MCLLLYARAASSSTTPMVMKSLLVPSCIYPSSSSTLWCNELTVMVGDARARSDMLPARTEKPKRGQNMLGHHKELVWELNKLLSELRSFVGNEAVLGVRSGIVGVGWPHRKPEIRSRKKWQGTGNKIRCSTDLIAVPLVLWWGNEPDERKSAHRNVQVCCCC